MNQKLAKALCKPELLIMGPIFSKALKKPIKIPIHFSSRRIYSFPDSLEVLAEEVGKIVKKLNIDTIAGGATAGIPLVSVVSLVTKIPMIYVRDDSADPERARYPIEGVIKKGDKIALLDDSLTDGEHKKYFIKKIEEAGGKVTDLVIIWDCYTKGISGRKMIEKMGIRIHYLVSWSDWFRLMCKSGHLSKELADLMIDFVNAPYDFQKNDKKWDSFYSIQRKQKGKFI